MLYSFDHLLRFARLYSVLLSAALPCFMAIKNVRWVIKIVHAQSSHDNVLFKFLIEHCVGTHKDQEMLAEMFGSFDHPELCSTEQG